MGQIIRKKSRNERTVNKLNRVLGAVQTGASTVVARRPTDTRSTCCHLASTPGSSAVVRAHCHAADGSAHRQTGPPSALSTQHHQQPGQRTKMRMVWLTSVETRASVPRPPLDVLKTPLHTQPYSAEFQAVVSGVGRRGTPSSHLKYLVESVPPRQVSQIPNGRTATVTGTRETKQKSSITEVEFSTKSTVM